MLFVAVARQGKEDIALKLFLAMPSERAGASEEVACWVQEGFDSTPEVDSKQGSVFLGEGRRGKRHTLHTRLSQHTHAEVFRLWNSSVASHSLAVNVFNRDQVLASWGSPEARSISCSRSQVTWTAISLEQISLGWAVSCIGYCGSEKASCC